MRIESDKLSALEEWQRVHPIAVLYFAAQAVKGLVTNIIVLVPIFIALRNAFDENPYRIVVLIVCALLLFMLFAFGTWWTFQFRVYAGRVEIKRGIFKKLRLNLPFDKIQDVKIEQPFYYRLTNTRVVALDTAGSAKQEANLVALSDAYAQQLSETILASKAGYTETASNEPVTPDEAEPRILNRRSLADLVLHGITNIRVWIILGVASPFIDDAIRQLDHWVAFVNLESLYSVDAVGLTLVLLHVTLTAISIFILITLISIVGAIVTFYDYTLLKDGSRLRRVSGLLTRYQVNLQLSRIQHIEYKQDWLDNLFGRVNVTFKQISQQLEGVPDDQRSLLVPSVTKSESVELGLHAFTHVNPFTQTYSPISKRFMLKYSLLALLLTAVAGFVLFLESNNIWHSLIALVVYLVVQGMIGLRWYRWGYALDGDNIYVRSGLFGIRFDVCPLYKLQQAKYAQSVWQARTHLANTTLFYASGRFTIPMLPSVTAANIIDRSLQNTELSNKYWM